MEDPEEELDRYCNSRVGSTLRDKWRLDRILGIGGMAAVYAASHRNGSTAALKVLHPQYAAVPSIRERFLREAYIANKAGHDGIVKVRDDELDEAGSPFLVMELLDGQSVADKADAVGGRLSAKDALWVGQELLAALEAAHAHGIVHRDIKPDNLFWTNEGRVKVLDFGIARLREDAPSRRTRTGMVFGTPGYMAPEQALGRWSQVDARTDLWAVGATLFNLLTGESVHEGETENERLVNAATRPARSLGRAMPDAPPSLVSVVDRALDFDQSRRYPDARAMRVDLERAAVDVGSLSFGAPRAPGSSPHASTQVEGAGGPHGDAPELPELDEILASTSPAAMGAMRELFTLLEKAMKARSQYGKGHKEVERRLEIAFAAATSAFVTLREPLAWQIRAYGFTCHDETLWEPKAPLDRVCYRLFSDGIRAIGLLPGLRETELAELVRILVADASSEIAPDDSLVTLLWDARLEHVLYEEGDPFVEGDQADRIAFEKKRAEVLAGAALDTSDQLEDAWRAHGGKDPSDREEKRRALLGAVAGGSAASAAAQASNMRGGPATARPGGLTADQATRAVMEARLSTGASDVAERFTAAAAAAFVMAFRRGEPSLVTAALRTSVFGLDGDTAAADTLAFVSLLEAGVVRSATADEREPMVSALVNALVPPQRLDAIIAIGGAPDASQDVRGRFLRVVRRLDGTHVAALAAAVSTMDPSEVRDELLAYVAKHAPGHEGEIGSTLAKGHLEPSLALLKVLTRLGTPAARMAAQEATRSPHPIVRIEALGLVEGASGIGIRQALRAMLEDWDPAVRLAALRSIATYKVKVAGPGLVMRVKSPEFEKLPSEERREALHTLFALTGTRAEAVCLELLADTRLVAAEPHEQSRAIAAEMLGTHGRSSESRTALEAACHGRWKNTERVRVAATNALKAWDERAARPSQAPPPSSLGGDLAQWGQTESPPPMSRPPIAGRIATPPPIAGRIATPPPIAGRIATPPPIAGRITTPPPIAGRLAPPPASAAEIRQRSEAPAAGGRRSEVPPASRRPIDPRSDPPGELPPGVDGSGVGRVERTNRPPPKSRR